MKRSLLILTAALLAFGNAIPVNANLFNGVTKTYQPYPMDPITQDRIHIPRNDNPIFKSPRIAPIWTHIQRDLNPFPDLPNTPSYPAPSPLTNRPI